MVGRNSMRKKYVTMSAYTFTYPVIFCLPVKRDNFLPAIKTACRISFLPVSSARYTCMFFDPGNKVISYNSFTDNKSDKKVY